MVSKKKRLLHLVVDFVVIGTLIDATGYLEGYVPPGVMGAIRLFIAFGGYYLCLEYLTGRTVGKFLTNTQVVSTEAARLPFTAVLIRTACRYVPYDIISPLLGADVAVWHDVMSRTTVVDRSSVPADLPGILDHTAEAKRPGEGSLPPNH